MLSVATQLRTPKAKPIRPRRAREKFSPLSARENKCKIVVDCVTVSSYPVRQMNALSTPTKAGERTHSNEHRFVRLNEGQRAQAQAMASRDGRPNCIGLRFTLDGMGNVNGFRDDMPHLPHRAEGAVPKVNLSAAYDLLAALRGFVNEYDTDPATWPDDMVALLTAGHSAIFKATGA